MTAPTLTIAHPVTPRYSPAVRDDDDLLTSDESAEVDSILAQLNAGADPDEDQPEDTDSLQDMRARLSIYQETTDLLVANGIPRAEIAWIHDAKTSAEREALFAHVRAGVIRVVLGSTFRMGVGVNIQERCYAVHWMTTPWRPCDVQQGDGRIWRPGNAFPQIWIFRYIAAPSLDGFSWQGIQTKGLFGDAYLRGDPSVRMMKDIDEQIISAGEIKALASGDARIVQKVRLEHELSKLQTQRDSWEGTRRAARWRLGQLEHDLRWKQTRMSVLQKYIDRGTSACVLSLNGKILDLSDGKTHKAQGKEIRDALVEWAAGQSKNKLKTNGFIKEQVGTYRGLLLYARLELDKNNKVGLPTMYLASDEGERINDTVIYIGDRLTIIDRMALALSDMENTRQYHIREAAQITADAERISASLDVVWEHARAYRLMQLGLRYLDAVLNDDVTRTEAVIAEVLGLAESEGLDIDAIIKKGEQIEEQGVDLSQVVVRFPPLPRARKEPHVHSAPDACIDPPVEEPLSAAYSNTLPVSIAGLLDYNEELPDDPDDGPTVMSISMNADPLPIARPGLTQGKLSLADMALEAARKKAEINNKKRADAADKKREEQASAGQGSMFDM